MWMYLTRILLSVLCIAITVVYAGAQTPLKFALPNEVSIQDSIPARHRERIVLSYKGSDGTLEARWAVVFVSLSFEQTRLNLRKLIQKAFGVESEREITASVQSGRNVNPGMPTEPLYGDGFIDFKVIGVRMGEGREFRARSSPYNKSGANNYSKSEWRVIDGSRLFTNICSLVVVSREDHSREWAWMHPGIPLPFKTAVVTELVTDTEIRIIEALDQENRPAKIRYFVPYTGYKTNGVINMMTAIRDFAEDMSPKK